MTESEMVWLATYASAKGFSFEDLRYCDYLYGKESYAPAVWEYVEELRRIGSEAFAVKYAEYKLY